MNCYKDAVFRIRFINATWEIAFLVLEAVGEIDPSTAPSLNALSFHSILHALRRVRSICHAFGVRIARYGGLRSQL